MMIIITSRIDGRLRGGIRHPLGAVEYSIDDFTDEQLRDIVSDETLSLSVGLLITKANFSMVEDLRADWTEQLSLADLPAAPASAGQNEELPEAEVLQAGQEEQPQPKAKPRGRAAKPAEG